MHFFRERKINPYVICYIFILILCILDCTFGINYRLIKDDFGILSSAAYLGGHDWSLLMYSSGYYGCGYGVLFGPLFYIFNDIKTIYQCILVISSFLYALSGPIAFYICDVFFEVDKKEHSIFIAVIASSFGLNMRVIWNEIPLQIIVWFLALALCKLYSENQKKNFLWSLIIWLLICYSLTLHERAEVYWFGLIIISFFHYLMFGKSFISWRSIIPGLICYYLSCAFIRYFKMNLWLIGTKNASVGNSAVSYGAALKVFDLAGIKAFFMVAIGQIRTINAETFGLGLLLIILFLKLFIAALYKKDRYGKYSLNHIDSKQLIVTGFFFLCMLGTVAGMCVVWISRIKAGLLNGVVVYEDKAITFIRYSRIYLGPCLCGILVWFEKKKIDLKTVKIWLGLMCLLEILWHRIDVPYLIEMELNLSDLLVKICNGYNRKAYFLDSFIYIVKDMLFVGLLSCGALFFFFIIYMLGFMYISLPVYITGDRTTRYWKYINSSYDAILEMKKANINVPEKIYVYTNNLGKFPLQALLLEHQIIVDISLQSEAEMIICDGAREDVLLSQEYLEYKLDDDEYIYTCDPDLQEWLNEYTRRNN